jgi:hypothetical protein
MDCPLSGLPLSGLPAEWIIAERTGLKKITTEDRTEAAW